jgi:hypothetical protein
MSRADVSWAGNEVDQLVAGGEALCIGAEAGNKAGVAVVVCLEGYGQIATLRQISTERVREKRISGPLQLTVRQLHQFVAQRRIHSDGPRFSLPIALARAMPRRQPRARSERAGSCTVRSQSAGAPPCNCCAQKRASLDIALDVVEGPGPRAQAYPFASGARGSRELGAEAPRSASIGTSLRRAGPRSS